MGSEAQVEATWDESDEPDENVVAVRPALIGFFAGVATVLVAPVLWAGLLRAVVGHERTEDLFWWVLLVFLVPLAMLARTATARIGAFVLVGMVLTFTVVAVTVTAVLWVMVNT